MEGPKGKFIIGSAKEFREDPLAFCCKMESEYDGFCKVQLGLMKAIFVSDPDLIKQVLATKNKSFVKGTQYRELKHFLKNGLLTSEGDTWFKQRRLAQPSFYKKTVESFFEIMLKYSNRIVNEWSKKGKFEALPSMNKLTLAAIGEAVFNKDLTNEASSIGENLGFMIEETNTRMWNIVNWPIWMPTKNNKQFHKGGSIIDEVVFSLIKERRAKRGGEGDLTQMLLDAEDADTGEKMNDQEVRDELMTIFVAGHETTALALSWTMYLIAKNPEVEKRIQTEIQTILNNESLTVEKVWQFEYVRAVLDEVMRLYPPAWIIGRVASEEVDLGRFKVEKGRDIIISPYAVHHSEKLWDNPETFNPDRFLGDAKKNIHKYAYFPFGGGPRICIGEQFAIMEMIIAIVTIYKNGSPQLLETKVEQQPLVTLRPKTNIQFNWEKLN